MKNKEYKLSTWSLISLIFNMGLIVGGFICPPIGIIDNSVLIAVGMVGLQGTLPMMFNTDKDLKVTHKDTTIEVKD